MGVDIMTAQKQTRRAKVATVARTTIIFVGLAGLAALSYHSATAPGSAGVQAGEHTVHSAAFLSPAIDNGAAPSPTLSAPPKGSASVPTKAVTSGTPAIPGPADPADPANRRQTSLQEAATTPHTPAGPEQPSVPHGPAPKLRGPVLPSKVFSRGADNLGGCLKEYGENGQCVPVVPPSLAQHLQDMKNAGLNAGSMPHTWSCSELRNYFPNGAAVRQRGIDPQHLDINGDGIACGPGD